MYDFNIPYNYDYNYGASPFFYLDDAVLGGVIIAILLFIMLAFAVSVVCYIFNGIGLYTLAKRRNLNSPFLAFIPVANSYLTGEIADDINRTMNKKSKYAKTILALFIVSFLLPLVTIPFSIVGTLVGSLVGLAVVSNIVSSLTTAVSVVVSVCCSVYLYIAYYKIYKEYAPDKAVLFIVLSILLPVTQPFIVFSLRNKISGYELWCNEQQAREQSASTVSFEEQESEHTVEEIFVEQPEIVDDSEQTVIDAEAQQEFED